MKINKRTHTPTFTSFKFDDDVSKELRFALKKSPAGKKFERKYDAFVKMQTFMSSSDTNKTYVGFLFKNVRKSNFLSKIIAKISGVSNEGSLQYNSKCQTEQKLITQLPKLHKDIFTKIYED